MWIQKLLSIKNSWFNIITKLINGQRPKQFWHFYYCSCIELFLDFIESILIRFSTLLTIDRFRIWLILFICFFQYTIPYLLVPKLMCLCVLKSVYRKKCGRWQNSINYIGCILYKIVKTQSTKTWYSAHK